MADEWVPEYADEPEAYGTSTSWAKRGYRPLRGLATPDFAAEDQAAGIGAFWLESSVNWCPDFECERHFQYAKICHGGTFSCWERRPWRAREHVDRVCPNKHVWTHG